jgi:uncharacterized protein YukE
MSTGDWFTLRPLNTTNYQPQIDQLNNRVSSLETTLTSLQGQIGLMSAQITDLQTTVSAQGAVIQNFSSQIGQINNNITTLTNTVNNLSNTVNSMASSIDNIVNLYKPISWFTYNQVRFTDNSDSTAYGSFSGAWYRPIKF